MSKVCKPVRELSMWDAMQKLKVGDKPVRVLFKAKWCDSCKAAAAAVQQSACDVQDDIETVAIDIDDHPALQQEFGIEDIPTLAIVHKGRIQAKSVGAMTAKNYSKAAKDWLRDNGYKGPV